MPNWKRTIDLKDTFHNDDLTIPQKAKVIVERIKASGWVEDTAYPDTLRDHLAELEEALNATEFGWAWGTIYDVADEDRVWLETR